jgi:hypothetical protein
MSWVPALLESEAFFRPCSQHAGGVVNLYNLETNDAVCPACAQKQPGANLLQVRGDLLTSRPVGRNAARRGAAPRGRRATTLVFVFARPPTLAGVGARAPARGGRAAPRRVTHGARHTRR